MGKRWVTIDGEEKLIIVTKDYHRAEWMEEQEEMREAFLQGKCYHFDRVYEKVCPVCGDTYYCINKLQIYCCDRCKDKARRQR